MNNDNIGSTWAMLLTLPLAIMAVILVLSALTDDFHRLKSFCLAFWQKHPGVLIYTIFAVILLAMSWEFLSDALRVVRGYR